MKYHLLSVTSLSTDLMGITGAQEPSGNPYVAPIVENKDQIVELVSLVRIQPRDAVVHDGLDKQFVLAKRDCLTN